MTLETNLLSCNSYKSFSQYFTNDLQLILDPNFGWEKIKINTREEYFNIERVTLHINNLSTRKNLDEGEINTGRQICDIFEKLWTQLDEQLKTLSCVAGLFYKIVHYPSSVLYSDFNPSWIDFWQQRTIVLKRSWGVFNARLKLVSKE